MQRQSLDQQVLLDLPFILMPAPADDPVTGRCRLRGFRDHFYDVRKALFVTEIQRNQ